MTLRHRLIRLALLVMLLVPVCAGLAGCLALDRQPAVTRDADVTADQIERAKQILESNDPRRMKTGTMRTVELTAGDADVALNYLAHRYGDGSAEARFASGRLHARASIRLSVVPSTPWANIDVRLAQGSPLPAIESFRVGRLPLPAWLAEAVLGRVAGTVWSGEDLALLRNAVKRVEFAEAGARVTYQWHDEIGKAVRAALMPPDAIDRLRVYQQALAEATRGLPRGGVSLARLLTPVFAVAAARAASSDPVVENRAAILVLTFYVDGRSLAQVMPEARSWPRAARRTVTLNGRNDLAKHFIISAALSANTGGPFADAVGIYKEIADSRGGSGFSFNDLAADRAGSRLGQLAEAPQSARVLQARLRVPLTERVLMPETSDLPEFMPEPEFRRRFGGVGGPEYARMMADIEARIAALPLYQ
ncbi:MAG TPA: hypothetical protein VE505_04205 [Vicinamibacterales bacterium]|nr:hypothetical protein [Vicinamibacterales bacterium]